MSDTVNFPLLGNDAGRFSLNSSTGILRLVSQLDYEETPSYTIVIHAQDNDQDGNVKFAPFTVDVTVGDTNDNAPEFNQSHFSIDVPEDTAIGASVFQASAEDPDGGLNGLVSYALVPNDFSSSWALNASTGVLSPTGRYFQLLVTIAICSKLLCYFSYFRSLLRPSFLLSFPFHSCP